MEKSMLQSIYKKSQASGGNFEQDECSKGNPGREVSSWIESENLQSRKRGAM